jgi:hypothetical protein
MADEMEISPMGVLFSDVYFGNSATEKNKCLKQDISYFLEDITLLCSCMCYTV